MIGLTKSLLTAYHGERKGEVSRIPGETSACYQSTWGRWLSRGNVVISLEDTVEEVAPTNGSVSMHERYAKGVGFLTNEGDSVSICLTLPFKFCLE